MTSKSQGSAECVIGKVGENDFHIIFAMMDYAMLDAPTWKADERIQFLRG